MKNWLLIFVILFASLFLGYLIWHSPISSQGPILSIAQKGTFSHQLDIKESEFIVSRVIVNFVKTEPLITNTAKYQGLKIPEISEADIGILLTSLYECPLKAWTMQEIIGSGPHGIGYLLRTDKTITYILPQLNSTLCKKEATEKQYKLSIRWKGRRDRGDWLIVVPGYSGTQNVDKRFAMFLEGITQSSKFDQSKADELQEYLQNNVALGSYNLLNGPVITSAPSLSFDYNNNQIKARINFMFSNSCDADINMEFDMQIWKSDEVAYVWARPSRRPKSGGTTICPDILQPVKKQVELSIPVPQGVPNFTILIPDYPRGKMFIKKIIP